MRTSHALIAKRSTRIKNFVAPTIQFLPIYHLVAAFMSDEGPHPWRNTFKTADILITYILHKYLNYINNTSAMRLMHICFASLVVAKVWINNHIRLKKNGMSCSSSLNSYVVPSLVEFSLIFSGSILLGRAFFLTCRIYAFCAWLICTLATGKK